MATTVPTRRLPRCPDSLEPGSRVVLARPDTESQGGRTGVVLETRVKVWLSRRPGDPPPQPPRTMTTVAWDDPRWPGERGWRWADELDVIE